MTVIAEIITGVALVLAAALITIPLRHWARRRTAEMALLVSALKNFTNRLSLPLVVIVLTLPAVWLIRQQPQPRHLTLWFVFWAIMAGINLLEGLALQIYDLRRQTFPVPALLRNIIRFIILIAVVFALLRQLNINISPLLASTALLTAVIGFALQGVLGNLLAGMSIHLTRSVMPNDWVAIGEVEGKVIRTNWRETRLRTIGGHTIVVPNSEVASSVIHNFTAPTPLRRHEFNVGASYSDAPGEVIEALIEAAKNVAAVLSRPAPSAYVSEYKDFGINYVLRYWSDRYHDRVTIDGDVGRMIWYQFKRRGIEIPFPMSDKLLNDFMAVVYRQRRMAPDKKELETLVEDLAAGDLLTTFLIDKDGNPLLRKEELRLLAPLLRRVRYTKGELIFRQGDVGESCFTVIRGSLSAKVEFSEDVPANEFEVGPGALLGEMSLMTGLGRTATVTSRDESELIEIDRGAFARLLGLRAEIPELLSRLAARRAAENASTWKKLKDLRQKDLTESVRSENIFKRFMRLLRHPAP